MEQLKKDKTSNELRGSDLGMKICSFMMEKKMKVF